MQNISNKELDNDFSAYNSNRSKVEIGHIESSTFRFIFEEIHEKFDPRLTSNFASNSTRLRSDVEFCMHIIRAFEFDTRKMHATFESGQSVKLKRLALFASMSNLLGCINSTVIHRIMLSRVVSLKTTNEIGVTMMITGTSCSDSKSNTKYLFILL